MSDTLCKFLGNSLRSQIVQTYAIGFLQVLFFLDPHRVPGQSLLLTTKYTRQNQNEINSEPEFMWKEIP